MGSGGGQAGSLVRGHPIARRVFRYRGSLWDQAGPVSNVPGRIANRIQAALFARLVN